MSDATCKHNGHKNEHELSISQNKPAKLPKLGPRLAAAYTELLKLAKDGDVVADIGTDHGFLAVHLAASGKFAKVIATDISRPSLDKARQLANKLNLIVECNYGNGMLATPNSTIAAICGMGGWEIIKILSQKYKADRFVLVAMQNSVQLRQFLVDNNYYINGDYLVAEHGKYYFVMSVTKLAEKTTINGMLSGVRMSEDDRYNTMQLYFGQSFDAKSRLGRLYLQNQVNNLKFLDNFDTLTSLHTHDSDMIQKINYYKLCKKLLQEGQNDPRDN